MRLFINHLNRTWKLGILVSLGLFGFHVLIIKIFEGFTKNRTADLFGKTMPKWMQSFFSLDQLPMTSLSGFLAVAYQHPFLLLALLMLPITIASGLLTKEVERKTLALLLARPLSRMGMVVSCAFVCAVWTGTATGACMLGTLAGQRWFHPAQTVDIRLLAIVVSNLYVFALAASGLAVLFSAWSSERGDAVGWCVTTLMAMYVWNFLAQVWGTATQASEFSLFHYYSPTRIFLKATALSLDYQVLGTVAAVGLLLAILNYAFRDFHV